MAELPDPIWPSGAALGALEDVLRESFSARSGSGSGAGARAGCDGRPAVTLAWAQSLNGVLGRRNSASPFILSSPESFVLTHRLRALHDAILVGIGTVLADNPRLDTRLVSGPSPRSVIIDADLKVPVSARCLRPGSIVFTRCQSISSAEDANLRVHGERVKKARQLERLGCHVVCLCSPSHSSLTTWEDACKPQRRTGNRENNNSRLSLPSILTALVSKFQTKRLMVEGGASVLSSFLLSPTLYDVAAVTISPSIIPDVGNRNVTIGSDVMLPSLVAANVVSPSPDILAIYKST